jgi:two-component system, chemotaxis family, protein-glutamate methylesterase/glutaminase
MSIARKIRVMVVDDSVVMRQIIGDALKSEPDIEIVALVQNGLVALEKLDGANPDVITLDIEMPEMDGLQTLTELHKRGRRTPVIMFSTLTERGAVITLEALARGAVDYVCKPTGQRNVTATMNKIRGDLLPKIRSVAAGHPAPKGSATSGLPAAPKAVAVTDVPMGRVELIVIGVSMGGPAALEALIPKLPGNLDQTVLVVQHMPPMFTRVLAERLNEKTKLTVREAKHQDRLEPRTVLIAPGDFHMRVVGGTRQGWITLDQSPAENGCRPAVDPLFTSAAAAFGSGVLAVVLTGLGQDGTKGAKAVRRAGGHVWVQDAATSAAWGMPGAVVNAGMASRIVPLPFLARAIADAAQGIRSVPPQAALDVTPRGGR